MIGPAPKSEKESLLAGTRTAFDEMAAAVRALAHDYPLTEPETPKSTSDRVDRMLPAAQGHWGDWDRTEATEDSHIRWRLWLLAAIPVGFVLRYLTNHSSPLLKAEVIVPVLAAAIGVLPAILNSGTRPGGADPAGTRHLRQPA